MILRTYFGVVALVLLLWSFSITQAQQNLLQDPSFEAVGDYKRVAEDSDGTLFDVPPAWNGWVLPRNATDPEWQNRVPTGFPHTALFKIDGGRSFHISRGFATFTAAVFQTVTVPEGANVRGSAQGFMEREVEGAPNPGGQFRVGIDPTGGSNPLSPSIIWSNWVTNDDAWVKLSVDATAQGTSVTLFLYATQSSPANPNGIYWDAAELIVGGGGGTSPVTGSGTPAPSAATAVPTAPPFASFVAPQPPQEDGSVVHIVQPGDTLAAIAVAYQTMPDDILALNNMSSGRFLQIGQRLVIRMAPPSNTSPSSNDDDDTSDETPTETETDTSDDAPRVEATATEAPTDDEPIETDAPTEAATEDPTEAATEVIVTEPPAAPVTQVAQVDNTTTSNAVVCLSMFNDVNRNRIREDGEALIAGGIITLSTNGETVGTYQTDAADDAFCLDDLTAGIYVAAAQPPAGYGLTTAPQLSLRIQNGLNVNASFGAAEGAEAIAQLPTDTGDSTPPPVVSETTPPTLSEALIQNIGLILFGLAGIVLIFGLGAALLLRRR